MSAVSYILVSKGQVLVEQRSDGKMKDCWLYPTEKLEPGEYSDDALVRGLKEELGIHPLLSYFIGDVINDWGYLSHVYAVLQWDGDVPCNILDDEQHPLSWVNVSEMVASRHPPQREMTDRLFKLMLGKHVIGRLK